MKIQVINPNTTRSMTAKIDAAARSAAFAGTQILCSQPDVGPASLETACDSVEAAPRVLSEVRRGVAAGCVGHVIACFDDPAVSAARELASGPVVGICQAAMHAASLIAARFSVITTARPGIPIIHDMAHRYGFARQCLSVRSAEMPVLALEEAGDAARLRIRQEALLCLEDGAEALILGCAGMADLADWLSAELQAPVVDGVRAGVKLVEGLAAIGLGTSKLGVYAYPSAPGPAA